VNDGDKKKEKVEKMEVEETDDSAAKNAGAIYFAQEDVACTSPYWQNFTKGTACRFQVYDSSKGLGAQNVTGTDGEAFLPQPEKTKIEEKVVIPEIDPKERFLGTVVKFVVHRFAFVKPESEDFKTKYPSLANKQFYCEMTEVESDQRPVFLTTNLKVTFSLKKDPNKVNEFRCCNVRSQKESKIEVLSTYQALSDRLSRSMVLEKKRLKGTVEFFNHLKSWGKIKIEDDVSGLPSEISELLGGSTSIYFHRDDLNCSDKVSGVEKDQKITFSLYKDEKGLGAVDIKDENNEILSGFTPPITSRKPEKKK